MFESFLGINFLNLYDTDAFLAIQLILTLMINCAIFKRMTDIRISWTVFLTLALLDVVIQYNITNMIMVFDVFILMILAFLAKGKTWSGDPVCFSYFVSSGDVRFTLSLIGTLLYSPSLKSPCR